ncbi:PLP-dependent aminotransferase family protein [Rhizobium binae]|nr:PLP-dependent aminotransferase family protein [Rhizobium binae]MBX4947538.1 PLP-dependent aminotransferase family protein [Rhizobium binae]MBX4962878.1 PLP-dependent aminotransferase family protein [Rhizobium binae]MBX4983431.1 PLP-dependent aminotransferase family protein [Rhizobium binae]
MLHGDWTVERTDYHKIHGTNLRDAVEVLDATPQTWWRPNLVLALELDIRLPDKNTGQLVSQLHRQLRTAIVSGRLRAGTQLPPTRKLALELGISRNSVVAAYDLLLSEGYLSGKVGSGSFVNEMRGLRSGQRRRPDSDFTSLIAPLWRRPPTIPSASVPKTISYDFRFGHPDVAHFPHHIWQRLSGRAMRQALRRGEEAGPPEGLQVLREAIVQHASFSRAISCQPENVVVTNGAQQGFSLLAQVLVQSGKTVVAIEDPGYRPARLAFATAGARIMPVPVDAEGIVVSKLPRDAGVIYVTPTHQSPLGVTMSARRRTELLAFAETHSAVIVEDDYDSEFRYGDRPHDALQTFDESGVVFYVGTFTKSMFPSLRLGFVVSPPWASDALIAAKRVADGQCAAILQATLADFILEGHLARHVRKMRSVYSTRNDTVLKSLIEHLPDLLEPIPTSAGIHCAAFFRTPVDINDVINRATNAGIAIEDLDRFWVAPPPRSGLAFGFSAIDESRIKDGIALLAKILT